MTDSRKAPHTRPPVRASPIPNYQLRSNGCASQQAIKAAERQQKDPASPSRILLINGSPRSEHTCPGESSKSWRLARSPSEVFARERGFEIECSTSAGSPPNTAAMIYPCKTCVSTAMPLCHWPCSCYPNHALGQAGDWMNEIYPMWAAAHGIMIVCPVNWYQAPSRSS